MKSLNQTIRRVLLTASVAGVAAAAIGGVSLAHAGGSATDSTFTVTEVQAGARFVDITHTPSGGPGDELILRSLLHNEAGDRIGSLSVACVMVLHDQLQCQGTYRLSGGTITGTAMIPSGEDSTAPVRVAITGGTGRFDGARGQIVTTSTSATTSSSLVDLD